MGAGQGPEQARRLREHPQTAALDKPIHFAVTRLGLTSGPGGSVTRSVRRLVGRPGQVWVAAAHPSASPFPFYHPRQPPK